MGFHEVPARPFGQAERADNVRCQLRRRPKGNLELMVWLGRRVGESLGLAKGDRVVFLWGRDDDAGADAGKVRIEKSPAMDSGVKAWARASDKRLRVYTQRLPDEIRALPVCAFDADYALAIGGPGGKPAPAIVVTLPFAVFGRRRDARTAKAAAR